MGFGMGPEDGWATAVVVDRMVVRVAPADSTAPSSSTAPSTTN